jgi:hypothetical protein
MDAATFASLPRAAKVEEALRLISVERLTKAQVAERFGMKASALRNLLSDPDGSKQRERRKRYQGRCVDCRGPTDGGNGRGKAPQRCIRCVRDPFWRSKTPPDVRRRVPVRLIDVPFEARMEGAEVACRTEPDKQERALILLAAIEPSETTYWIAA